MALSVPVWWILHALSLWSASKQKRKEEEESQIQHDDADLRKEGSTGVINLAESTEYGSPATDDPPVPDPTPLSAVAGEASGPELLEPKAVHCLGEARDGRATVVKVVVTTGEDYQGPPEVAATLPEASTTRCAMDLEFCTSATSDIPIFIRRHFPDPSRKLLPPVEETAESEINDCDLEEGDGSSSEGDEPVTPHKIWSEEERKRFSHYLNPRIIITAIVVVFFL